MKRLKRIWWRLVLREAKHQKIELMERWARYNLYLNRQI